MIKIKLFVVLSIVLAVTGCSNQNTGTVVGATSGLLIGSVGGPITAGVGLGVGALAGVAVGTAIDNYQPHSAKPVNADSVQRS